MAEAGLRIEGLRSPLAGPFQLLLNPGEIAAISGASGSGKSLFLRMIADLDPNSGEVFLNGAARSAMTGPAWRRQVPYVAAESGWWAATPADHFAADQRAAATALAERLGVAPALMNDPVERLSTGERQRLALVRGFVLNAPVLLLDEPTGPLDPDSVGRVEALILERAAAGTILVVVTHDPAQGARLKARRWRMADRKLTPDD